MSDIDAKPRDTPLIEAIHLINSDRNQEYGEPYENFRDIAEMMTVLLRPILKDNERVMCHHVAMVMMAVKLSRMTTSPLKHDTWVDIAGYVGTGWEAMKQEHEKSQREFVESLETFPKA
jgi:hypothetical protein